MVYQRKANSESIRKESSNSTTESFQDNRPSTVTQRKIQSKIGSAENKPLQRMPDQSNFPTTIHDGQQSKHDEDSKNYLNQTYSGIYKSVMKPQRAQELLTKFRNSLPDGENPVPKDKWPASVVLENENKKRVIADFGQHVGNVLDEKSGEDLGSTNKASIMYGSKPHLYPTD